ncbi:MAG TPA: M20/M25/M40 family metallo-hydrolase [Terriglobales bacterium]|nr:M20/M25/M40 family metallo-hydrolase [Terriglobales bacterium]
MSLFTQHTRRGARRSMIATLVLGLAAASTLAAQTDERTPEQQQAYRRAMEKADLAIQAEVRQHSELMKNLEYLTTEIGPRLTGSPQMQEASRWTLARFRAYGLDAHLETTTVPHAWYRGHDTAAILTPIRRTIPIRSLGWSKATPGTVTGKVLVVTRDMAGSLNPEEVRGAIVLAGPPATIPPDFPPPDNAYDAVIPPPKGVPQQQGNVFQRRREQLQQIVQDGAAVLLLDSGKEDNLFNMGSFSAYQPSPIPLAFLTHEDYDLIYRLAQAGPVTMNVNLNGTFSAGPESASITVAQIKGSEWPDQQVIVGGHLDSWDLGQGALDNGTGAMSTLEAARALHALGWKPKRTITFVLFTGEEEGGVGAQLFVKNHAAEIPDMDGVLIDDTGTGKVFSIALENLWETAPLMSEIYRPLQEVFDLKPLSTRYFGASDHVEFLNAGVPAYFCVQKPAHYRQAHHSQADTFDLVKAEQVNEGAALLAAWAWNVSEMPERLPHHPARSGRGEF